MSQEPSLHLAIALDGTGWHPASWREPGARADELFTAGFWVDQVREAEAGLADLVTFEDSFALDGDRADRAQGRLDAQLVALRVGPVTSHIGLVPTVVTTHTEPFHVSTEIATLDFATTGRAGVRVRVSSRDEEYALFGRREAGAESRESLFDEAADHIEVQRRLWDSWEDDAEIRDAATGRFVDRDKLHYIDFEGGHFSVRGPSITPRPPQGQPLVSALAHVDVAYRLAARGADLVFVTPGGVGRDGPTGDAEAILRQVRAEEASVGRDGDPLHVLGDLLVVLDDSADAARARLARLDETDGSELRSDARILTGTATDVADVLASWHDAGLAGARLRPAVTAHDLPRITRELVPELQRRGLYRTAYDAATLRGHFGLARPADRYARV
ncbi:alkanesulfonate monooxygenase SsuD/methylene tetrahydromethanopterin reductase-like flavin-dependent oxidoreductase (luciferase family) [Actinomycetospora succinea]|uniref:Alkanesulfonate monooxygenase SsuD/methylene tetrahydromethanopterin reductase-like flavin-dependent oxidoreductase (Luciferase family) n=1 Tax=Actinomycetospora succinea TaxID=663603 RepID=A0A4V3D908_9PSEU|nr:LLM class flavin-dependent oxidoreductase [Actinomycetospora succinea]TDQ54009.1 alkanesulfonate monooxygenase SsuD/methylene tetrahydromethanopterin reductase-like flavin-dependent oxidoreductase (luciferase family) [Actinomycetospora succinea]